MRLLLLLILVALICTTTEGQRVKRTNKFAVGAQFEVGHSFPNFSQRQSRWRGIFYPAFGFSATVVNRISPRWTAEIGLGATSYFLVNQSAVDRYVLDFISPKAIAGVSYSYRDKWNRENFLRLTGGAQLGYRGRLLDRFETYEVLIEGKRLLYPFIKPEVGFRRYFRKRMKGSRFRIAYEIGTFFRYNFFPLGRATIFETDLSVTLVPRGNIIGMFCRFLLPVGSKRVKQLRERAKPLPPVIYSPRQNW